MKYERLITAVDSHTVGHPTRVILSGLPRLQGSSVREKADFFRRNYDHLRRALIYEPRGHFGMFAAALTEAVDPRADWGVVFMATHKYLEMCGHGTIGVATVLVEMGLVEVVEPETVIRLEVPAGLIEVRVRVLDGRAEGVIFRNRPAFVLGTDVRVLVPGVGELAADLAYGGNVYVLLSSAQVGIPLAKENVPSLIEAGSAIKSAVNQMSRPVYPGTDTMCEVDHVLIYGDPDVPGAHAKNIVIPDKRKFDRSPCGTGTSARMACLHHRGELAVGTEFVNEGILGTTLKGRILEEVKIEGNHSAVIPEIEGMAYVTGVQQFMIDARDPLRDGFLV